LYSNYKSNKRIQRNVYNQFSLKLNKSYLWVGIICCLLGSVLMSAAIKHWNKDIYIMSSLTVVFFLGMGIIVLSWYYNYELIFDEKRIIASDWKRKKITTKWSEIENIKFSVISGYLKLYSKNERIVVHQHSIGFVEFLRFMEMKTNYTKEELKIPF